MSDKTLFKISFVNQDKIYEIFARQVAQSGMYGFVEVEELVFDTQSSVVVDPSEERLKSEFSGVKRSYIPMHAVIRIDEVEKRGTAKIFNIDSKSGAVTAINPDAMAKISKPENTKG
jgi:hypothetical protein